MNLAKLFLKTITETTSADSVANALTSCADEMHLRMGNFDDEEETVRIFFGESEDLGYVSNEYTELMELKSVYQTYAYLLSPKEKQNLWILDMIEEAEVINEYRRNQKLLSELSNNERKTLDSLCFEIENICNAKYIQFMIREKTGLILHNKIEMTAFEKSSQLPNYVIIQNQIIETMLSGGIAYVVAGSVGLTPQRVHGFILSNNGWCKCQKGLSDLVRKMILGKAKTQ